MNWQARFFYDLFFKSVVALGLRCSPRAAVAVPGLLCAVASLVAE